MDSKDALTRQKTLIALQRIKTTNSAPEGKEKEDAASNYLHHQGGRDPSLRSALRRIHRRSRS
jgi:hypothetical protein